MKPDNVKPKIEDLKIYKTLCKVMSPTQAKCELMKLQSYGACDFRDSEDLSESFIWTESPQGEEFWEDFYIELVDSGYCILHGRYETN